MRQISVGALAAAAFRAVHPRPRLPLLGCSTRTPGAADGIQKRHRAAMPLEDRPPTVSRTVPYRRPEYLSRRKKEMESPTSAQAVAPVLPGMRESLLTIAQMDAC